MSPNSTPMEDRIFGWFKLVMPAYYETYIDCQRPTNPPEDFRKAFGTKRQTTAEMLIGPSSPLTNTLKKRISKARIGTQIDIGYFDKLHLVLVRLPDAAILDSHKSYQDNLEALKTEKEELWDKLHQMAPEIFNRLEDIDKGMERTERELQKTQKFVR